jgi:hypothetical protein
VLVVGAIDVDVVDVAGVEPNGPVGRRARAGVQRPKFDLELNNGNGEEKKKKEKKKNEKIVAQRR